MELVEKGIIVGTSENTFTPDGLLTRAQWVTLLWRAAGKPEPAGTVSFDDVSATAYYAKAFAWAAEEHIVEGMGNNLAAPQELVTRQQMVTMLFRYSGEEHAAYDLSGYTDVNDVSYYAVDAFEWAVAKGYISGMSATILAPQGTSIRAQAATVLYRYLVG